MNGYKSMNMGAIVIGTGRRARMVAAELPLIGYGTTLITEVGLAVKRMCDERIEIVVISPEFSPDDVRAIASELKGIAGGRKLHIFAFDEAVEGYEAVEHVYLGSGVDAVIGIFSARIFKAAYRYVRDRHGTEVL